MNEWDKGKGVHDKVKELGIWSGGVRVHVCVCAVVVQDPAGPGGRAYVWGSGGGETTFNDTLTYAIVLVLPGEHCVLKPTVHVWAQ